MAYYGYSRKRKTKTTATPSTNDETTAIPKIGKLEYNVPESQQIKKLRKIVVNHALQLEAMCQHYGASDDPTKRKRSELAALTRALVAIVNAASFQAELLKELSGDEEDNSCCDNE